MPPHPPHATMSLQFSGSCVASSIFGSLHRYLSRVKEVTADRCQVKTDSKHRQIHPETRKITANRDKIHPEARGWADVLLFKPSSSKLGLLLMTLLINLLSLLLSSPSLFSLLTVLVIVVEVVKASLSLVVVFTLLLLSFYFCKWSISTFMWNIKPKSHGKVRHYKWLLCL